MKLFKIYRIISIFLLALLLNGCATNSYLVWEHPFSDQTELTLDQQECRKISQQIMLDLDPLPMSLLFNRQRRLPKLWLSEPVFHTPQLYQEQIYRSCMTAKDWELVRKMNPVAGQ